MLIIKFKNTWCALSFGNNETGSLTKASKERLYKTKKASKDKYNKSKFYKY